MAGAAASAAGTLVLEVDPDLGRGIDPAEVQIARQACHGELSQVPRGPWEVDGDGDPIAFVIVDGLLTREIGLREYCMVEFLGRCDVFQPPVVTESPSVVTETRLTAVSDLVLLVLGESFVHAAGRWPTLLSELHHRLEAQRESLAIQGLIAHLPTAEHRLLLMLWHLADRWGYVTPDGIVLPWPLNHEILGRLIGARRPTVTIALRGLEDTGGVRRHADGSWLLTAVAERMIQDIARSQDAGQCIGERMMLYKQITQATAQTRAPQAEAKQGR